MTNSTKLGRKAPILSKMIVWFGQRALLACDGQCDKAWGIDGRPKTQLGTHEDDYVWKRDSELGIAPGPGKTVCISEGSDIKPSATMLNDAQKMNKWCSRQCERGSVIEPYELFEVPDLEHPMPNMPHLHRS